MFCSTRLLSGRLDSFAGQNCCMLFFESCRIGRILPRLPGSGCWNSCCRSILDCLNSYHCHSPSSESHPTERCMLRWPTWTCFIVPSTHLDDTSWLTHEKLFWFLIQRQFWPHQEQHSSPFACRTGWCCRGSGWWGDSWSFYIIRMQTIKTKSGRRYQTFSLLDELPPITDQFLNKLIRNPLTCC